MGNATALIFITFFIATNIVAITAMFIDKERSRKDGTKRIPEGILFFMAAAFGSFGIYAGMFLLHHKIRKWYFLVGIPILMIENLAFLYLTYAFISGDRLIH